MTRGGMTLVELTVVLLILSLLTGLSGLAVGRLRMSPVDPRETALRRARMEAIRSGAAVGVRDSSSPVLFLPDGRAIGAGVDPLTGEPDPAKR